MSFQVISSHFKSFQVALYFDISPLLWFIYFKTFQVVSSQFKSIRVQLFQNNFFKSVYIVIFQVWIFRDVS
jgi:hypothetical protein